MGIIVDLSELIADWLIKIKYELSWMISTFNNFANDELLRLNTDTRHNSF